MCKKVFLTFTVLVFAGMTSLAAGQEEAVRSKDERITLFPKRGLAIVEGTPFGAGFVKIFDNIGSKYPKGSYSCCQAFTVAGPNSQGVPQLWQAVAFTPGANHTVTKIVVAVGINSGTGDVYLSLNSDDNNLPGKAIKIWHLSHFEAAGECCLLEAKEDASGIPVKAGTQYWVVVSTGKNSDFQGGWNANDTNQVNSIETAFYCLGTGCSNSGQWTVQQSVPGPTLAVLGEE
jgi:hypothetical protein